MSEPWTIATCDRCGCCLLGLREFESGRCDACRCDPVGLRPLFEDGFRSRFDGRTTDHPEER